MAVTEAIPESVRCKIVRALEHSKSLDEVAIEYLRSNPGMVVSPAMSCSAIDLAQDQVEVRPEVPVPLRIPLIVGDVLQNLRSSLDYLVWELVLAEKNQPTDKSAFPICRSRDVFENELRRHRLDGVSPNAIAEIEGLQPYRHGQDWEKNLLYVLDHFCNINKHRRLLLTRLRGSRASTVHINGQPYLEVLFGDSDYGREVRHTLRATEDQVKMEGQVLAFLAFNEGPAKGWEVGTALLNIFNHFMDDVMPRFEKFFHQKP